MYNFENEPDPNDVFDFQDDDDFDVKITDLPPDGQVDSLLANFAAFRTHISSKKRERPLFQPGEERERGRDKSGPYGPSEIESDDDFDLEISDLPENENHDLLPLAAPLTTLAARFSTRKRRKRVLSLVTVALVAILTILVVLEGKPSAWNSALSLFARPTPTPAINSNAPLTSGPPAVTGSGRYIGSSPANIFTWHKGIDSSQVIPIQDPLGPAPQSCPRNTGLSPDAPTSTAIGSPPLWVSGFDKNGTALTQLQRAKQRSLGWYETITLFLQSNYTNVVVLQGANNNNNAPVFLDSVPSNQGVTALLLLDPSATDLSNHTVGDQSWIVMNTNLYIPAAGCYSLTAEWATGSWTVFFAAGK